MKLQLGPSPIADEAPALPSPRPLPPPVSNSSCLSVQCQPECQLLYGTAEVFKVLCCRTNDVSLFFALVFHTLFLCRAVLSHFSCVRLFATLWTTARQAPLSMGFPRKNTGVGCHALLQGIFPTQGSNTHLQCLLHCRRILCC